MLNKALRLGKKELKRIFKSKTRYFRGNILTVRTIPNKKNITRFAFVVSGPKNRAAALRNLTKRRMSAAVENMKNIQPGLDIVLFIRLEGREVPSFAVIKSDIYNVLAKNIF